MKKIKNILVVEDNEADQIITEHTITQYDSSIELHKAYDGQEAIDVLSSLGCPPDIIFLDINMPGMNGHEFLSEYAKADKQASVVVMLTTSDQTYDKEQCLAYSFVKEYLIKPLEIDHMKIVSELL